MKHKLGLCLRLLGMLTLSAVFLTPVRAQQTGLTETFDDAKLPGWELSSNAQVTDGVLHIEPSGYAFHPGSWADLTFEISARFVGDTTLGIGYSATDQGEYTLQVEAARVTLLRNRVELAHSDLDPIPPGEWMRLVVTVSRGRHEIRRGERVAITATDPDPLPPGGVMLRAVGLAAGEFDDLRLTAAGGLLAPTTPTRASLPGSPEPTQSAGGAAAIPASGIPAYQAESWVNLGGPPGDLGYDIRYNFADHQTWYVTDGSGGFFISKDRGLTWSPSNTGISTLEGSITWPVFSATVDPHNPQTIWIGTQIVGHIYKSIDGGLTWTQMDNGVTPNKGLHFRGFTVDPRSSDTVYAQAEVDCYVLRQDCLATVLGSTTGGRVYRTTDGGQNWKLIWEGEAIARYLWIDPADP